MARLDNNDLLKIILERLDHLEDKIDEKIEIVHGRVKGLEGRIRLLEDEKIKLKTIIVVIASIGSVLIIPNIKDWFKIISMIMGG